jgi:hypothetical protein
MLRKPSYVKYRRESGFGLVYDHENYDDEDAKLLRVDSDVIGALEHVDEAQPSRDELESVFSRAVVDSLLERGLIVEESSSTGRAEADPS